MAKNKQTMNRVSGGTRRRRNVMPQSSPAGDSSLIKYSALGSTITTSSSGIAPGYRSYIPGKATDLVSVAGPAIVGYYSTAVFKPGTKIRWEPSISFSTAGRVFCGFSDNYEVLNAFSNASTSADQVTVVKGLGSLISFPAWQETDIAFPTRTRRKRFDVNETTGGTITEAEYNRSCQTTFYFAIEGANSTTYGSFWYHDVVDVEGVHNVAT